MVEYIARTFSGVETTSAMGYIFFFYGTDRRLPFATVAVTDNEFDSVSKLDREGVYRLNIGVDRETYRGLLGEEKPRLGPDGIVAGGHDFTELDRILPHPVYAPQSWVAVLNPGRRTWNRVQELLAEAYERAVERENRADRSPGAEPDQGKGPS